MPNIGPAELLVVLIVALVVFGPRRLPDVGRQIGRALREFRNATADIRSELGIDEIRSDVGEIKSHMFFFDEIDHLMHGNLLLRRVADQGRYLWQPSTINGYSFLFP